MWNWEIFFEHKRGNFMEFQKKEIASSASSSCSSSSFTADLFGSQDPPPSSSTGIFASIFPPPSKVLGRKSSGSDAIGAWQKQASSNPGWNIKQGFSGESDSASKDRAPNFQEERVEPCHLSSSLYYGGRDNYSQPPSNQNSGEYPLFKKDRANDNPEGNQSNGASRGNWWQGSLYY